MENAQQVPANMNLGIDPAQIEAMTSFLSGGNDEVAEAMHPVAPTTDQTPPPAATTSIGDTRTAYRGVYLNTHKNRDKFKFRVSLSMNGNKQGELHWIHLGYYNCILVAALAYNVAALGTYLGSAKLNAVDPKACNTGELDEYKKNKAVRLAIAETVIAHVTAAGGKLNYLDNK